MKTIRLILGILTITATLATQAHAQFNFTTNNGAITITGYTGPGGDVTIPDWTNGYPVTSIETNAFFHTSSLTNVTMGTNLTSIGNTAFGFCGHMTNITLGASVTSIGQYAFEYCPIRSLTIPNSVTNIGFSAFLSCLHMTDVLIPNSVAIIGPYAFNMCQSLTSVTIPGSVTNLGYDSFTSCISLTNVTIGSGVTYIPQAFNNCTRLTTVMIAASVSSLGPQAFAYCTSLTSVYFQGNVPSPTNDSSVFPGNTTIYYLPDTTGWGSTFDARPTALWNPTIQTTNASFGVQNNQFGFTIVGTPDIPIALAACTNPASPNWTALQTCTLTNGSIYFTDPDWTNHPTRFYRIRSP
ncbi:MAG: leucine-rich repeat domain-containing protein [Verrucomicrobiota bacterium]